MGVCMRDRRPNPRFEATAVGLSESIGCGDSTAVSRLHPHRSDVVRGKHRGELIPRHEPQTRPVFARGAVELIGGR